ncbi:MAG: ABC transporter ATP-binding protein [Betaproteobacteria bacterium]|nr:ABC transporter ATP-binding protein [Betaproteobacteria bacterium]
MSHIRATDLVVDFPIYDASQRSLRKAFLSAATGGAIKHEGQHRVIIRPLDRISFDFREGDRVGVVGHNGAGKTTLLRVLNGVYEPVGGSLDISGRLASLLDITNGFDPDATGYENIVLRGLMMGVKPREIRPKMAEIAEFSGLGEYLDLPLRTYSSGMVLRLAFAVSTSVDADILLMDEWLSVGDAEFNEKASQRLNELISKTAIIVIASHDMAMLSRVCNRIIRLEHGRISEDGQTPHPSQ